MKNRLTFVIVVTVAALATAPAALAADQGAGAPAAGSSAQQMQMQTAQGEQLSAAEDLRGTQVRDSQGQVLGAIEELVVDIGEGTVAYLIVEPAQYAGEQVIIPWKAVQPSPPAMAGAAAEGERAVVLAIPRSQLLQAPETGIDTLNREQERAIHQFYGVSPYWEGDQQPPGTLQQAPPLPPGHPPVLPPGHPPVGPEGTR